MQIIYPTPSIYTIMCINPTLIPKWLINVSLSLQVNVMISFVQAVFQIFSSTRPWKDVFSEIMYKEETRIFPHVRRRRLRRKKLIIIRSCCFVRSRWGIFHTCDNHSYLMFSWQVEFWLAKKVLLKLQGSRAVTENQ